MKVDEDILKKDLLQLLSEMELFDYYRGSKKLHLNSFATGHEIIYLIFRWHW